MPDVLNSNEQTEAWQVVEALDSLDFSFKEFDEWRKNNQFQVQDIGKYFTLKGIYGYVQFEYSNFNNNNIIVNCFYVPLSDVTKAFSLVKEGKSASGKTLPVDMLNQLKVNRYNQVETVVIHMIYDLIGENVKPYMTLRGDLAMDEEIDIPELCMKIEDEFDILIQDEKIQSFSTVADLISYIQFAKGMSS
jgi:acyl carrier protein